MEIEQAKKHYIRGHSIVYSCQYHVVFCPQYGRPVLTGQVADRLKALIMEKQGEYGYQLLDMEVLHDRDVNAAVNILKESTSGAAGSHALGDTIPVGGSAQDAHRLHLRRTAGTV